MGLLNLFARIGGSSALEEGGENAVNQLFDFTLPYRKVAADGAAGTATVNDLFFTNPFDCNFLIVGARAVFPAGITGDPANYAKVSFKTDNALGGAPVEALSFTTQSTDLGTFAANVSKAFNARTPSACLIVPGANVFLDIAKLGTGVIVPISAFTLRLRKQG